MGQRAASSGGGAYMAVLYDEAARKAFHRRSLAGDASFDIEVEVTRMSEEIWLDAEAVSKSRQANNGHNGQSRPPADHWHQQHKGSGKGQKSKGKSWQMPTNSWPKQARPPPLLLFVPLLASCFRFLVCQDKGHGKSKAPQHHAGNGGQAKGNGKAAQK